MSITLNTQAYEIDSWKTEDRVTYRGPAMTDTVKDELTLGRTRPKPTADNPGVSRSNMKLVCTEVVGGVNKDVIINVDISKAVGVTDAFMDGCRDKVGDLLISPTAGLIVKHDLTH